jgi:hypothetical protein
MAPVLEAELKAEFGADYDTLMTTGADEAVGARDWLHVYLDARDHSLAELLRQGTSVPRQRLRRIRAVMRGLVSNELFRFDADAGAYGQAAQRLQANGAAEVVVMGHTHLARHHGPQDKAFYINTGTWADLITVSDEALADSEQGLTALEVFLRGLIDDSVRWFRPTYADIRLAAHGAVEYARLEKWPR